MSCRMGRRPGGDPSWQSIRPHPAGRATCACPPGPSILVHDRRATIEDIRIERIEWARLTGERPRKAGCNSRLGEHGLHVHPAIARLTTADGASGFGASWISPERAEAVVGFQLSDAFQAESGVTEEFRLLEYPLWDLVGSWRESRSMRCSPERRGGSAFPATTPRRECRSGGAHRLRGTGGEGPGTRGPSRSRWGGEPCTCPSTQGRSGTSTSSTP